MALVLNPAYNLVRHSKSIILYNIDDVYSGNAYVNYISPAEAIILALYDGTRNTDDLCHQFVSTVEDKDSNARSNMIVEITNYYKSISILVERETLTQPIRKYNPLDFSFDAQMKAPTERLDQPIVLVYLATKNCPRACIYCFANAAHDRKESVLSIARLRHIIDEASDLGIKAISVSGGEPFLRKDFPQIAEYMLKKDIHPNISTKAYVSEYVIQMLRGMGLRHIQVSLDSADKDTANMLAGSSIFFDQIIKTIDRFTRNGVKVHINCVVTSYNIRQVPELVKLAFSLGVEGLSLSPYAINMGRHSNRLFPDIAESRWLTHELKALKSIYQPMYISDYTGSPSIWNGEDNVICAIGMHGFVILPGGEVLMCERLPIEEEFIVGNLKEQSIMEVWAAEKWNEVRTPPREKYEGTECYSCECFQECSTYARRCIVHSIAAYGKKYAPEPGCPRVRHEPVRVR